MTESDSVPARRILVISPHFDDAPLSLGESMRRGAMAAHSTQVLVVFGRTNWTTWVHPTPSRAKVISTWRRMEESLAGIGFSYRSGPAGGWAEVVLRSGDLNPEAFVDPTADVRNDPLIDEIGSWIKQLAETQMDTGRRRLLRRGPSSSGPPELILVPAGIGGHRDHMIVAVAASRVSREVSVPFGFYEDRPYAAYVSPQDRATLMGRLDPSLEPFTASPPIRRSTQWMARACYPSQMSGYFTDAMSIDRAAEDTEKLWFGAGARPSWL